MPKEFLEEEASYTLSQKAQKDSTFYKANPCFPNVGTAKIPNYIHSADPK